MSPLVLVRIRDMLFGIKMQLLHREISMDVGQSFLILAKKVTSHMTISGMECLFSKIFPLVFTIL